MHEKLLPNQLNSSPVEQRKSLKSGHQMENFLSFTDLEEYKINLFESPYLKVNKKLREDSSMEGMRQAHLLKSARLNISTALTPKPHYVFGLRTMSTTTNNHISPQTRMRYNTSYNGEVAKGDMKTFHLASQFLNNQWGK